jgi:hypothetical protein
VEKRCGHWGWTTTTFTPSPIIFALSTVSTRVYGTCIGAAKIMSCRAAVTSQWLRTFAALRVAQCSCALCCLYNDVELGPLQDKKSNLCTPYCTLTWFTYSPRRATTTTVLDFRRLPSSRRLGFSSDRNITKRPCHPVWSCCWHVGTRTVLPNLYDAIFACHLNGQFCFTRCFQHPFYKTTKTLQREVFTLQYSLTDHECDPM